MDEVKVATILDNRRVIFNAGKKQGVALGDRYKIFAAIGKEIKDPDTKKVLGTYEIEKLPVEVVELRDEFCVAETYQYKEINEGGNFNGLTSVSNYLMPPKIVKRFDTFDVDSSTRSEIDEAKSIIKVGDIARKINASTADS